MRFIRAAIIVAATVAVCGCSTVMEYNRPQPVNLKQLSVGEGRMSVLARLGPPITSEKEGQNSCDLYRLYTRGLSGAAKAGVIVGEGAADVFTLGLFEVVGTAGEAATKSRLHAVIVCYAPDNKLVSVTDEGDVRHLKDDQGSKASVASQPVGNVASASGSPPASSAAGAN